MSFSLSCDDVPFGVDVTHLIRNGSLGQYDISPRGEHVDSGNSSEGCKKYEND